ncbi:MAG: type II secretion system F family protein, partial [Deltaproteobacteria bacterium]|nr:type II secretion system F family protein [Deltaproteobacteria bacterium]
MAVFEYTALNSSGRKTKGVIDADSQRAARNKLKQQGIFPTSLEETRQKVAATTAAGSMLEQLRTRRVSGVQVAMATRQLATLVGSGMPLVDALRALSDLVDHAGFKRVIAEVSDRVNEGSELSTAMRHYPRIFSRLYVNMIHSGQANGRLDLVLERLADLLESQAGLRRKIVSAITYPMLMLVICVLVIIVLLTYVVPEITLIFRERGALLPLPTRIVITLSDFLRDYILLILAAGVAGSLALARYTKTEKGRAWLDRLRLRIPIFGPLSLKVSTSRFARNLGTLLASDVPLLEALRIVKNILG